MRKSFKNKKFTKRVEKVLFLNTTTEEKLSKILSEKVDSSNF